MKKAWNGVICVVLALFLLVGCTAAPASSGTISLLQSPTSGVGEGTTAEVPEWKRTFYNTVLQNLQNGDGLPALWLRIFLRDNGEPVMSVVYGDEGTYYQGEFSRVWRYADGKAELAYNGSGIVGSINLNTGNPIVREDKSYGAEEITYFEIVDGEQEPLYTRFQPMNAASELLIYPNQRYTQLEEIQFQPLISLGVSQDYDHEQFALYFQGETLTVEQLRQKLADYFLGEYQPAIPAEAPDWVRRYVQYVHTYMPYAYTQQAPEYLASSLTLLEMPLGRPPVIENVISDAITMPLGGYNYFTEQQILYLEHGIDGGYRFLKDSAGNVFLERNDYMFYVLYRPQEAGIEYLFSAGYDVFAYEGDCYAYAGEEQKTFTTTNEADEWFNSQKQQLLLEYGAASGELEPVEETEYSLPTGNWQEWENALIEALCEYAQKIGQWGA